MLYLKTKLHGLSPRAYYTDRVTAACRRSDCQLLRIEVTCYIYSSYMYDTYIRPLSVQARTADYALSRVVHVATQFDSLKVTPWSESASELYRPTERPPLVSEAIANLCG
jgi:hypothetical protein